MKKKHEKIDAENGTEKESKKNQKHLKSLEIFPKMGCGGVARNACILHSTLSST